ncbi:MAG: hypothetical protein J7K90_04170, partial [Desulfuromusa sp.]|nr:hypothetical protein [Desulfuromusa sp.]
MGQTAGFATGSWIVRLPPKETGENMETTRTDPITEEMSVLDIISTCPETEMIFRSYDEQVG